MTAPNKNRQRTVSIPGRHNQLVGPIAVILYVVLIAVGSIGAWGYFKYSWKFQQYQKWEAFIGKLSDQGPPTVNAAAAPETLVDTNKTVHMVFDPPFPLSDAQRDYREMAKGVICEPQSWGVKKPSLFCDQDLIEFYTGSVLWSENGLSHYNANDNVAWSYTNCCAGGSQVLIGSSVCTKEEILDFRTNPWCGAAIFWDYYQKWGLKAGPRALEITVAVYKNAVVMEGSEMKLGDDGLPIIPPDDPNDPYDFWSQVSSSFLYNGKSMYRFVEQ